jgi:hypothetical protein
MDTGGVDHVRTLYLIFSHDNIEQLVRLVASIRQLSPHALISIHHDPRHSILDLELFALIPDVYLVPQPIPGEWGDFSLVAQYLHAMKWCLNNLNFDWLVSITGLSYPIKPLTEFEEKLELSEFDAYVYHFDAFDPGHWPVGTAETRYLFRYIKLPKFYYYYKLPLGVRNRLVKWRVWLNAAQPLFRIVPMPRGAPTRLGIRRWLRPDRNGFRLYAGRQMLNIKRSVLSRIFEFIEKNPSWLVSQRRALIPDESFFNSIIVNDSKIKVCNDVLRYIKWPPDHAASVAAIKHEEVDEVMQSGAAFALKLDSRIDPLSLDKIDNYLGIKPNHRVCSECLR